MPILGADGDPLQIHQDVFRETRVEDNAGDTAGDHYEVDEGAPQVAKIVPQREFKSHQHGASSSASWPSEICTTRRARSSTSGSWLPNTTVTPSSRFKRCRRSIRSNAVFLSTLAVGSSAIMIAGR